MPDQHPTPAFPADATKMVPALRTTSPASSTARPTSGRAVACANNQGVAVHKHFWCASGVTGGIFLHRMCYEPAVTPQMVRCADDSTERPLQLLQLLIKRQIETSEGQVQVLAWCILCARRASLLTPLHMTC